MKAPDELVKVGVDAGWPNADKYRSDFERNFRHALEAVLPKVFERIEKADTGYGIGPAISDAFPGEGSSERCQLRHLKVAGFTCSCGWTAPAGSADIDDIDVKNPPQEGS